MISLSKSFLFVHIPKTGGNSIQGVFRKYSEDKIITPKAHQDGIERFEVFSTFGGLGKHATLLDYKREAKNINVYKSLFKIATVRNPWDRLISYYFSPNRGVKEWDRESFIKLLSEVKPIKYYIKENNDKESSETVSIDPGHDQLDSDMDYIIHFENLDHDFKKVCSLIDIYPEKLPKRNVSSRKHYSFYYDDELKEMIRRKFKDEIECFGYEY